MKKYKPQPEDKVWLADHLAQINEGGVWAIPRAFTVYKVSNENKTLTILVGSGDHPTEMVAAAIGWKIAKKIP